MKKKLVYLKDKLNDLSMRNRSIRLMRLYNKWNIDLKGFDRFSGAGFAEKVVEAIRAQKDRIVLMRQDISDESAMAAFHVLTTLHRNLMGIEEETGLHDLSVGYPFLSGTFLDGSYFRAPLFLYPARLEKVKTHGQEWVLQKDEGEPQLNRSLFLAFKKFNQMNISEEMFEEAVVQATSGKMESWVSWLSENHIKVTMTGEELEGLMDLKKDTIPQLPLGSIHLEPLAILGSFPQGNSSILKDYEDLIELSEEQELGIIESFINVDEPDPEPATIDEDSSSQETLDEEKRIRETEYLYLVESDGSQEEILREARDSKGMVIHGPPGTGKSQVIVNLIVDAIAKGKKVMLVCQKRAALDVVYQRLEGLKLSQQVALIHDDKNDRKPLYAKISSLLQHESPGQYHLQEFQSICARIEERETKLNQIAKGLFEIQPHGYRAYDLYGRSKPLDHVNKLIQLANVLDQLNKDNLEDLLAIIKSYAEYLQRFGKEEYPLKHRQSFDQFELKDRIFLVESLETLLEKARKSVEYLSTFDELDITPEYSWLVSDKLEKIYDDLDPKQKKSLQKLRLWWWTSFTGKSIISELLKGDKFKGLSSTEWVRLRDSLKTLYDLSKVTEEMTNKLDDLRAYFTTEKIEELKKSVSKGDIPIDLIDRKLEAVFQDFEELRQMDRIYTRNSDTVKQLIDHITHKYAEQKESLLPAELVESVRQSAYIHWIDEVENKFPDIVKVTTPEYSQLIDSFKNLLDEKRKLGSTLLVKGLLERANEVQNKNPKVVKDMLYQAGKKRRIWPLRKYVQEYSSKGLLDLLPVWLTSPETVSTIFPLQDELFDVVIFDEASQCTIENGIPSVYRAKQVFIAGDEKQLPPSNLFKGSISEDEDEELEFELQESESLLNLAKRIYPEKLLQWHYRSKSEELINFSNHAFYNGQVQIAPNVEPLMNPAAIRWEKVDGRWINQCNEIEAVEVVTILKKQLIQYPNQSVGIITFNAKQQEKILDMIDRQIESDPEFSVVYHQVMGRSIDERVFVKNIENVQGDERDCIIFSIGYAKNEGGRVYNRFGTLNQQGGENRLNVAITRSKQQIIVVSSIEPHELHVANAKQQGPRLFKSYLEYAKAVSKLDKEKIEQVLTEVSEEGNIQKQQSDLVFDSPFEEQVYQQLTSLGYKIDTQVGLSGYRIDLAITHPTQSSKYILGIECDGAMYHSSPSARERDIYRQRFLEAKGWRIVRIWSRNWWKNPSAEIERIDHMIKDILQHEEQKEKVMESASF